MSLRDNPQSFLERGTLLVEQVLQREVVGHGCRWVELNDCQNLRQQAEARLRKTLTKTERIHSSAASSS